MAATPAATPALEGNVSANQHRIARTAVAQTTRALAISALSRLAQGKLHEARQRIEVVADVAWEKLFTPEQRAQLRGDLAYAYWRYGGTLGMYLQVKPRFGWRAVLEIARGTDLLSESDYRWLEREISRVDPDLSKSQQAAPRPGPGERDVDDILATKRERRRLVLVQGNGRETVYWDGHRLDDRQGVALAWAECRQIWDLFWRLAQRAKLNREVTADDLNCSPGAFKNRMWRLRQRLPEDLAKLIHAEDGSYRLHLKPDEIHAEELCDDEVLAEDESEWKERQAREDQRRQIRDQTYRKRDPSET